MLCISHFWLWMKFSNAIYTTNVINFADLKSWVTWYTYKHHEVVYSCKRSLRGILFSKCKIDQKLAWVLHNFIPGGFFQSRGGGSLTSIIESSMRIFCIVDDIIISSYQYFYKMMCLTLSFRFTQDFWWKDFVSMLL